MILKLGALLELALLVVVAWQIRRVVRVTRERLRAGASFHMALQDGLVAVLRSRILAGLFASELTLVYYALTGWLKKTPRGFTAHRVNHYPTILGLILFLLVVESVGMHILVARLSVVAAWILSAAAAYALVWIVGDFHALRLVPTVIDEDRVRVRIGLRWEASIPRDQIVRVGTSASAGALKAVTLGAPNVAIAVRQPLEARGPFGIRRQFEELAVTVYDPVSFVAALG